MKTLKEIKVGQSAIIKKFTATVHLKEELWIWVSQRVLRSMYARLLPWAILWR